MLPPQSQPQSQPHRWIFMLWTIHPRNLDIRLLPPLISNQLKSLHILSIVENKSFVLFPRLYNEPTSTYINQPSKLIHRKPGIIGLQQDIIGVASYQNSIIRGKCQSYEAQGCGPSIGSGKNTIHRANS